MTCENCLSNEAATTLNIRRGGVAPGYTLRLCDNCANEYRATFGDEARTPEEWSPFVEETSQEQG